MTAGTVRPPDRELTGCVERLVGRGRVRDFELLDDKPGQRCVARVTMGTERSGADRSPGTVFVKWFRDTARGQRNHDTLLAVSDALAVEPTVRVPEPLGFDGELGVLVIGAAGGEPLARAASVGGLTAEQGRVIGSAVAAFHRSGAAVPAEYHLTDERRTWQQWAEQVAAGGCPPELVERYVALVGRADHAADAVGAVADAVIHRDLHLEHLYLDERGVIWLIDLDEVRAGDATVDLAHLAVHVALDERRIDGELLAGWYAPVHRAWEDRSGARCDAERFAFQATLACLKIARQRVLGFGTRPRPVGDARWATVERTLALGGRLVRPIC